MGFWIARSGEVFPNPDHYGFVLTHAKLFGLTAKGVKGFGLEQRSGVLDAVIAKGWIRVRGDQRQGLSFEVNEFDQTTVWNIKQFLVEKKWDPKAKVLIDETKYGASWYEPVNWFLTDEALKVARNPKRKRKAARRR